MPILKKYHYYVNIRKTSNHVKEIIPMSDIKVSDNFYNDYEDRTGKKNESADSTTDPE